MRRQSASPQEICHYESSFRALIYVSLHYKQNLDTCRRRSLSANPLPLLFRGRDIIAVISLNFFRNNILPRGSISILTPLSALLRSSFSYRNTTTSDISIPIRISTNSLLWQLRTYQSTLIEGFVNI